MVQSAGTGYLHGDCLASSELPHHDQAIARGIISSKCPSCQGSVVFCRGSLMASSWFRRGSASSVVVLSCLCRGPVIVLSWS